MQAVSVVLALLLVAGSVTVNGQTPGPSSSTSGRSPTAAPSKGPVAPAPAPRSNGGNAPSPATVIVKPIAPSPGTPVTPLPANNVTINNINTVVNTQVVNSFTNNIVNVANNNQQITSANNFIDLTQVNQFAKHTNINNVDVTVVNTALTNLIQLSSGGGSVNINQFYYNLQVFALYIQKQSQGTISPSCPTVLVGNKVCYG